jgi:hypothetical protein
MKPNDVFGAIFWTNKPISNFGKNKAGLHDGNP